MTPEPTTDPSRTSAQGVTHASAHGEDSPGTVVAPERLNPAFGWPDVPGFVVTAEIARGGMGCVYAGRELGLDREVAIKTLLPGANRERFVTESRITAKLPHPNIPPVYAFGRLADDSPFLAMKLVRGRTLADILKERASPQTDLPRFVQIFEQIAQAVGFAHGQSVIHRDLKPLNVMVGAFGEVQVMDWGLAKLLGSDEQPSTESLDSEALTVPDAQTRAGQIMGTPAYMAPEQARGEPVDARTDVFALGSILAVVLTGRPAFVGDTVDGTVAKAARGDLADAFDRLAKCGADRELIDLARTCLAASPSERPASGLAVAGAVADYRAGVESRLRAAETAQAVSAAAAAIIAVLTAGVAVSLVQAKRARDAEADQREQRIKADDAAAKATEEERKATEREADERKARHHAERQQQIAEKTRKFLVDYFAGRAGWSGNLSVGGPSGPNVTLREVIAFAEGQIGKEFADFPEAELDLRVTFATMRSMLNNSDGYERHAKRARELAKQLGLENSSAMRTLEAHAAMFGAFRSGQMIPSGLAGLVGGATPTGWSGGTAESAAVNGHIIKGAVAFQKKDFATAEKEFRAAVAVAEKAHGSTGPSSLTTRLLLGSILRASDQPEKAQAEFDAVVAIGQKVEWGVLPVALARAYSRALRVTDADDADVLKLADAFEQSKADFDRLGLWDTEHGALLVAAMARLRQAQKRPAEAAELLARNYQAAIKNPLLPIGQIAHKAGLAYAEIQDARAADFYLTAAMNHPSWANVPADDRAATRSLRGSLRVTLGRLVEAEADLRPDIPEKLRGNLSAKYTVASIGAAVGNREYLQPYLDATLPQAARGGPQAVGLITSVRELAAIAQKERNFELAVDLYTPCIELIGKQFGQEPALDSTNQRGQCLEAVGRHADAARDFRVALAGYRRSFGDAGGQTRAAADALARTLGASGNRAEEIRLRKQTFEATQKALGDRPDAAWEDAARLLAACRAASDYSAIDPTAKTTVAALVALTGRDPSAVLAQQRTATKMRPRATAVEVLAALAQSRADTFGELHQITFGATADLLSVARDAGLPAATVPMLERLAARARVLEPVLLDAGGWVTELAATLETCDRWADAEPWRRKWLSAVESAPGANPLAVAGEQVALGTNLLRQRKWADAEAILRECFATREKLAPDLWSTFNARSVLGGALLGQKRYNAAEPLLVSGYEGMKAREKTIPPTGRDRLPEAADRLIELARARADAESVTRWRAERARYKELAPPPRAR